MNGGRGVLMGVMWWLICGLCVYWRLGKWIKWVVREEIGGRMMRVRMMFEMCVFVFILGMVYLFFYGC